MPDSKTILAILGIIVTAGFLLIETSIINFATDKATTGLEEGLTPITNQVPNGDKMIPTGQTWDDLKSVTEDTKNVVNAPTKGIKNTMTFGWPVMIILAAILAILGRLGLIKVS